MGSSLDPYINFIQYLLLESSKITLPFYDNAALVTELKDDCTPVTKADRDCELFLREKIKAKFPQHGIIGEEYGEDKSAAEWCWVLDPIDGTASFIHGVPLFTTLIGLMYQGKPVLGGIFQPVLNKLCIGSEAGTFLNGVKCAVRLCTDLSQATFLSSGIVGRHGALPEAIQRGILPKVKIFRTWGDGWGYMMVASGQADIMMDGALKIWDLAAVLPIINGAGGVCQSLQGGDPLQDLSLVACHPELIGKVLSPSIATAVSLLPESSLSLAEDKKFN